MLLSILMPLFFPRKKVLLPFLSPGAPFLIKLPSSWLSYLRQDHKLFQSLYFHIFIFTSLEFGLLQTFIFEFKQELDLSFEISFEISFRFRKDFLLFRKSLILYIWILDGCILGRRLFNEISDWKFSKLLDTDSQHLRC